MEPRAFEVASSFPAWSGTRLDLHRALMAIAETEFNGQLPRLVLRSFDGKEDPLSVNDLDRLPGNLRHGQLIATFGATKTGSLRIIFGPNHPLADEFDGEVPDDDPTTPPPPDPTGNVIVVDGSANDSVRLTTTARDALTPSVPAWGRYVDKGQLNPLRLENMVALGLLFVSLFAGAIVIWPDGAFFGAFLALALIPSGLELAGVLFPRFELHDGRPQWRRRLWLPVLIGGLPLAIAVTLRLWLGDWTSS